MIYDWYYIFNAQAFSETGFVQRSYSLELDGIGKKDILVTKGNFTGITYEGVFLPLRLTEEMNPFEFEGLAIYIDDATRNVFLGFAQESE